MIAAGIDDAYLPASDYILAEYVHHSQKPRCVPVAINGFIELFFGVHYTLFGHQLGMYYSPQRYNIIVGGRGSGKTVPVAIIMAIWTALHPGEPWLHAALSLDQAKKAYSAILDLASKKHYRSDGSMTERTFAEVFIQDKREFPQPDIYFKPWDEHDGGEVAGAQQFGNRIMFRPLGDDDLERLRSTEAGQGSGDEILREVRDAKTINHLRGCLRGLNPWALAHLPAEKRMEISRLQQLVGLGNVQGDQDMIDKAEVQLGEMGVDRLKRFFAIGNAGEPEWVWEVMDLAEDDPRYAWFIQVSMYDNIRLSPSDRASLEEAWGNDPEARQVELMGKRPLGLGTEIDPQLLTASVRNGLGGTILKQHPSYGTIHYEKPPQRGHFHIIAGDPGKGKVPDRNAWCVIVLDISAQPAEIVYFEVGNLKIRSKTYSPYLKSYKYAVERYPVVSAADIIYDNGGQQSGMHEVILGSLKVIDGENDGESDIDTEMQQEMEGVYGNPYSFTNSMKYTAANWLIDLLRKGRLVMPRLEILIRQTSNWKLPDKDLAQDTTMALFMLVYRGYHIISNPDMGYATQRQHEGEYTDDGFNRWTMPKNADVLHPVTEKEL
jgi:hypothetical protein